MPSNKSVFFQWICANSKKHQNKIPKKNELRKLSLNTIPNDMLFQILYKMPILTFCRLRQTCTRIDAYIKLKQKLLASRHIKGVELNLRIVGIKIDIELNDSVFDMWLGWDSQLSGIPISRMNLYVKEPYPETIDYFLHLLENSPSTCDSAEFHLENIDAIEEISRLLNSIYTRYHKIVFDDRFDKENLISLCQAADNSSKIIYKQRRTYNEDFQRMVNFKGFMITGKYHDASDFRALLIDIYNCSDFGIIETVTFELFLHFGQRNREFPYWEPNDGDFLFFDTLWTSHSTLTEDIPQHIYLMETGRKYLVICIEKIEEVQLISFYFQKKFSDVLDRITTELHLVDFSGTLREEFLKASVKRQGEILLNVFEKEHGYKV